ncbi:MAG: hypothetical protein AAF726_10065 [Planctomycetota bacterium]
MDVLRRLMQSIAGFFRRLGGTPGGGYLCDSCKWDYGDACNRRERPNARTCPDYKRR